MTVHDEVLQGMKAMAAKFSAMGVKLVMPPPSNIALGTIYTEIDYGKMLAAQIKFDPKFCNPMMIFQGGFLCAAFDEVYGPLTYMVGDRPASTIEMSTSFIRPFTAKEDFLIFKAELVAKTKSLIILKGEARNPEGKLFATSSSHSLILNDTQLGPH
jgi:acyl-coenzyme A thioesterase PaaI-like protein